MSETSEVPQIPQNISQVKQDLLDPRAISKKLDPEGRKETAGAILQARGEGRESRDTLEAKRRERQNLDEQYGVLSQQGEQTEVDLARRNESKIVKLKGILHLGDAKAASLQTELAAVRQKLATTSTESVATSAQIRELQQMQEQVPDPKQLLEAYYEKVASTPLTNQEKRELLTPDVLANLTTEEYIALWRRLNPHFLAHVTRQGFRDHTGGDMMVDHTRGYREFNNGFTDMMGNGRSIFPPIARVGLGNRDEATVKSFVQNFLQDSPSADKAKERFLNFLNRSLAAAPNYPDITATHLAAQMVSDGYYGGERDNEVFFAYPSDVLASQYAFAFNGWEKDLTRRQSETKWNDVFIWTDPNQPGVPVDSGIVFLAEKTPVDPETGSKYASEIKVVDGQEKRVMIEDTALVSSFVKWGKKLDDQSPLKKVLLAYIDERHYDRQLDLKEACFAAFARELQGLGVTTDSSDALASKLIGEMVWRDSSFDDEELKEIIENSSAHLKRAENTVPAKQYWESFFAKNPGIRPKHIQYYDGNPTTAVFKFQQQNNIGRADTSKVEGNLLGFDDHHIVDMESDPRANKGYKELVDMGNKIIEEHYQIAA